MPLPEEESAEKELNMEPKEEAATNDPECDGAQDEEEEEEEEIPEGYDGPYKMVFVVNSELGMGVGKVAAQVGHATLGLYRQLMESSGNNDESKMSPLDFWEYVDGEKKIVLKGESTQHLHDLLAKAKEKCIESYLVCDAGLTQIPEGSNTVLSIFGRDDVVNQVTGKLKLL